MTRELIFVQTGQCGNQIGSKYWDVALRDLAKQCQTSSACFDRSMNVLFRNLDHKTGYPLHIGSNVSSLKARAVLVDMEKGVIDSISRSPLGELFTQPQNITDVSGSGNNWATGYVEYGSNHGDDIMNAIRTQLESCDCVDSVVFLQSLSGGTGSGLGSFILDRTADDFSKVNRMMIPVFPSVTDDVVTAPYNSVLALNTISENGNIVMTVDNDSLFKHYNLSNSQAQQETHQKPNPFDAANTVVAEMIQGLSFSLRFGGDSALFPSHIHAITCGKQKFLSPAIYMGGNTVSQRQVLSFEKAISSRYDEKITLCRAWRKSSDDRFGLTYWGGESIATVLQATSKANPSGISLFGHTQVGTDDIKQPCGVLKLSRNGSMHTVLEDIRVKFSKFYKRKAHLHHYLQHIEASHLEEAVNNLMDLIATHRGQSGPSDIRIVQERSRYRVSR
jgi:tubulin epsilon